MPKDRFSHVIGFDDAPFGRDHRGDVLVIGAAYAGDRLSGVISTRVRRDGANAGRAIIEVVRGSRFFSHTKAILFQGIALAGFNVLDIHGIHAALGIPVLVVARRPPGLGAIEEALRSRVRGGARKWRLIQRAGAMEPLRGVMVQRAGLSLDDADRVLARFTVEGRIPEPLRVAHLIAGGVTTGHSRGRA